MLECNLSGRRVVSVSEVYHKRPPGRDRLSVILTRRDNNTGDSFCVFVEVPSKSV